ncbi:XRE family transcriptional regulator [Novosphingobium huizhouense]|uniref:XRE family transcriptional regulator n=1 Tax=Novosphingobium huizhouense TaxID=2866625 RepID=UPI001CD867FC|nr:S24 family peptidase [Novosphingobium huizhouense]
MAELRPDRLIALREERGLSQAALAREVGVGQSTLVRLEKGETRNPREILAIARALDCSPEYLLGESDERGSIRAAAKPSKREKPAQPIVDQDDDVVQLREIDLRYGMGARYLDLPIAEEMRSFSREWLRSVTRAPPEYLFWATGDGDSMEPTIRAGETFLIDTSQRTPRMSDGIWALAVGEIGMVKRLHFDGDGVIELHSDNQLVRPSRVSEDELHIIGRVVAVVRRL